MPFNIPDNHMMTFKNTIIIRLRSPNSNADLKSSNSELISSKLKLAGDQFDTLLRCIAFDIFDT